MTVEDPKTRSALNRITARIAENGDITTREVLEIVQDGATPDEQYEAMQLIYKDPKDPYQEKDD